MQVCTRNYVSDENLVEHYFGQIRNMPRLTIGEERELSRRGLAGDESAKQRLVETNLRLVVKIAKGYIGSRMPFLDIIQEGNLGLVQAAARYDYRKNVKFATYASWWIRQAIVRYIVGNKRIVRLPYRKEAQVHNLKKATASLGQRLHREPTAAEVAQELGKDIREVQKMAVLASNDCSLNRIADSGSGELIDSYIDTTYSPEMKFFEKSMREETRKMLDKLMEMERQVLLDRFFYNGKGKKTLRAIGERYNVSAEAIRQIERRALRKLQVQSPEMAHFLLN
jgi:RNA polymerase primary sigma factor